VKFDLNYALCLVRMDNVVMHSCAVLPTVQISAKYPNEKIEAVYCVPLGTL